MATANDPSAVLSVLNNALCNAPLDLRWRSVPMRRLTDLRVELEARRAAGEINETFWQDWLSRFCYAATHRAPPAASVLVVAVGQPLVRVRFWRHGQARVVPLPPAYLSTPNHVVSQRVQEALTPFGHWAVPAAVPVKLLAARSGLSRYGRNNLAYTDGLGSYCKLLAFVTSMAPSHDEWADGPGRVLERCAGCDRCSDACPQGAIGKEHFLVQAERCLTYYNERAGDFPALITPAAHHCILGCILCQTACPQNQGLLKIIDAAESFDDDETDAIMRGVGKGELRATTLDKLEALNLLDDYAVLGRNLKAVLDRPPVPAR